MAKLLARIAGGGGLVATCEELGLLPQTVLTWVTRDQPPGFSLRYFQALQARTILQVDQIVEIVDRVAECDSMARVRAARSHADVRRWLARKLIGELGDRIQVKSSDR